MRDDHAVLPHTPAKSVRRRVTVVLARPYLAFQGGDGAYLDSILKHLQASGCELTGLITSTSRGRFRPLVRLVYSHWLQPGWRFRGAVALGPWRILLSPAAFFQLFRGIIGAVYHRRIQSSWAWLEEPDEVRWIEKQLKKTRPDITVFCFEAAAMIPKLRSTGRRLALVGFLPNRIYSLDDSGAASVKTDGALGDLLQEGLEAADAVALNNISDCVWWTENRAIHNRAVFAGMSPMLYHPLPDSREEIALFVGNKTAPNVAGLAWFLERIWPNVIAARPSARLRVVGRVAEWVKENYPGVELVGKVLDISKEYALARAVVVPLINGSAGVKTKLVEAVAYGRSFVATSVAIEPEHRHIMSNCGYVTDGASDFALAVKTLLANEADRLSKQSGAKAVYDQLFSDGAAYGALDDWIGD